MSKYLQILMSRFEKGEKKEKQARQYKKNDKEGINDNDKTRNRKSH